MTIGALGFGWCADLYYGGHISTTADPVYGVRWYGSSKGSPSGDNEWGLDDGDNAMCGNTVNLDDIFSSNTSIY